MGRSVETIGDNVIYFDASELTEEYLWTDLTENLRCSLKAKYKSLENDDTWAGYPYRENQSILCNGLVNIYISEYCGGGAISIVPVEENGYYDFIGNLADHWLDQVFDGMKAIIKQYVDTLYRLGTFSNGCGVYKKDGE